MKPILFITGGDMKKKIVFIIVLSALALASCATAKMAAATQAPYMNGLRQSAPQYAPQPSIQDKAFTESSASGGYSGETLNTTSATSSDRLVIMNASVTVVVADPQAKMDSIAKMAADMGGFVVSMNMSQTYTASGDTAPQGTISIRVPADNLDSAMSQIKAGTVEVRNETRTGSDVTAQYTDLQSQLTNLEQAERDLQAIMDEAKDNPNSNTSSKTQDVLSVYNQIVSVRGQIEQIKGQMQYYEQSSSFSLIDATLIAEETIKPIEIGGWKPQGVARDAIQALVKFLQGFVNFLIWLALLVLPVLIVIFGPIALVIWLIVVLVRRRRVRKARAA